MQKKPYVIGIIGPTGSGKSMVAKLLAHLGARHIDADALAHLAMLRGQSAYESIVARYGKGILTTEQEIDRAKLAKIVFSNQQELDRLEAFLHPQVGLAFQNLLARTCGGVVTFEAVKLIESGLYRQCDSIWLVNAAEKSRTERLIERGMKPPDARRRVEFQTPIEELRSVVDVEIDNSASLSGTWQQVTTAWDALAVKHKGQRPWFEQAEYFVQRAFAGYRLLMPGEMTEDWENSAVPLSEKHDIRSLISAWLFYTSSENSWLVDYAAFEARAIFIPRQNQDADNKQDIDAFLPNLVAQAGEHFCHTLRIACKNSETDCATALAKHKFFPQNSFKNWARELDLSGYNISSKQLEVHTYAFQGAPGKNSKHDCDIG